MSHKKDGLGIQYQNHICRLHHALIACFMLERFIGQHMKGQEINKQTRTFKLTQKNYAVKSSLLVRYGIKILHV